MMGGAALWWSQIICTQCPALESTTNKKMSPAPQDPKGYFTNNWCKKVSKAPSSDTQYMYQARCLNFAPIMSESTFRTFGSWCAGGISLTVVPIVTVAKWLLTC